MAMKKSILFLCTHNSARSQLAEGLMRFDFGADWEVFSAGTERTRVKSPVLIVLEELGIDARAQWSKTVADLGERVADVDVVVTVCDEAKEHCPYHPGKKKTIHRSFADPSNETATPEEAVSAFRSTRDDIRNWLKSEFG